MMRSWSTRCTMRLTWRRRRSGRNTEVQWRGRPDGVHEGLAVTVRGVAGWDVPAEPKGGRERAGTAAAPYRRSSAFVAAASTTPSLQCARRIRRERAERGASFSAAAMPRGGTFSQEIHAMAPAGSRCSHFPCVGWFPWSVRSSRRSGLGRAAPALRHGARDDRARAGRPRSPAAGLIADLRDGATPKEATDTATWNRAGAHGSPPAARRGEFVGVKGQLAEEEEQVHDEHTDTRIGRSQA